MIVLDASALLAFLFRETGADDVGKHLDASVVSTVNLSEVLGRFARDGIAIRPVNEQLLQTSIEWVSFDEKQAELCAKLQPRTRALGLSLGDRACLALAALRGLPALTADRTWDDLDIGVEIRCIR